MRFVRFLLILIVVAGVFVAGAVATLWGRQMAARTDLAESQWNVALARAESAETRAAVAEASLTAIAVDQQVRAKATATASAQGRDPRSAVDRALKLVFAMYQEPSDDRIQQASNVLSPAAMSVFRAEVDHLREQGLHLGGDSTYKVDVLGVDQTSDGADVRTQETWTYDERDDQDQRKRCLREDSQQTYKLKPAGQSWAVDEVDLITSQHQDC